MPKRRKQRPKRLEGDWQGEISIREEKVPISAKMFHRGHLVVGISINEPADRSYFFIGREEGKGFKGRWWRTDMKNWGTFAHEIKDRGRKIEGSIATRGSRRKMGYTGRRK